MEWTAIGPALQHTLLQLLDEQTLATDLGQRGIEDLVTLGAHTQQFHLEVRVQPLEFCGHVFGLPHGKR